MSHVLLGGDEQEVSELRILLTKWGVTVGRLVFGDAVPTVMECDAVILQGRSDEYRDACQGALPDGSGGAVGPAAPLIFINSTDEVPLNSLPAFWLVLDRVDQDGANLQMALQSSFASAQALRGDSVGETGIGAHHENDTYLHFLGHELRSPLTAIKTSLEVIEAELGRVEQPRDRIDANLKMLAIAQRNVRRLHQTVEWSQDLLASGVSTRPVCTKEITVAEMAARLGDIGEVRVDAAIRDLDLQTDPELLESLVTRMARAVGMACPEAPIAIQLASDPEEFHLLHLVVAAVDGEQGRRPVTNRYSHLVASNQDPEPVSALDRLARLMVASHLVEALTATLTTPKSDSERPALVLTLNLVPAAALSV